MKKALGLLLACLASCASSNAEELHRDLGCYNVSFMGPVDAVRSYLQRQKARFEEPDPAVVDAESRVVRVTVTPDMASEWCAALVGLSTPLKLVFASAEYVAKLTVPLTAVSVEYTNGFGRRRAVVSGIASLAAYTTQQRLLNQELDLYLVFDGACPLGSCATPWEASATEKLFR